jgi:division protein CdvB (Snf7/Vps24/ESCRT-III family)
MENIMNDAQLDAVYTRLCTTMTQLGEAKTSLFLARFALLAIGEMDDANVSLRLIDEASDGIAS